MSNLAAAVGRGQLEWIDRRSARRREIFFYYQDTLGVIPGLSFPEEPNPDDWFSTRWLTTVLVQPEKFGADRETIRLALAAGDIEARPIWKPMHLQPFFAGCERIITGVADRIFRDGLCLPSCSDMTDDDLGRVVKVIRGCRTS